MGLFGLLMDAGRPKILLRKIRYTYLIMMKLGTVRYRGTKNYINHMIQPLISAEISIFHQKL